MKSPTLNDCLAFISLYTSYAGGAIVGTLAADAFGAGNDGALTSAIVGGTVGGLLGLLSGYKAVEVYAPVFGISNELANKIGNTEIGELVSRLMTARDKYKVDKK